MRLCRTNCAFLSNDGLCVEMMVSGRGRVALGCDEPGNSIFIREGLGKTSRAKTLATFGSRGGGRGTRPHPPGGGGPPPPPPQPRRGRGGGAGGPPAPRTPPPWRRAPHGSRQQSVTEEPALQREAAQGRSRRPEPAGAREPDALLHAVLPEGSSRLQPGRHAGLWL